MHKIQVYIVCFCVGVRPYWSLLEEKGYYSTNCLLYTVTKFVKGIIESLNLTTVRCASFIYGESNAVEIYNDFETRFNFLTIFDATTTNIFCEGKIMLDIKCFFLFFCNLCFLGGIITLFGKITMK